MRAWGIIRALGPIDLKSVGRDPLLKWIIFIPLIAASAMRWLLPPILERIEAYCRERGETLWKVSALRKVGLEGLLGAIQETLEKLPPRQFRETQSPDGEPVSEGGDSKR